MNDKELNTFAEDLKEFRDLNNKFSKNEISLAKTLYYDFKFNKLRVSILCFYLSVLFFYFEYGPVLPDIFNSNADLNFNSIIFDFFLFHLGIFFIVIVRNLIFKKDKYNISFLIYDFIANENYVKKSNFFAMFFSGFFLFAFSSLLVFSFFNVNSVEAFESFKTLAIYGCCFSVIFSVGFVIKISFSIFIRTVDLASFYILKIYRKENFESISEKYKEAFAAEIKLKKLENKISEETDKIHNCPDNSIILSIVSKKDENSIFLQRHFKKLVNKKLLEEEELSNAERLHNKLGKRETLKVVVS